MSYQSFKNADRICDEFLALLSALGINPPTGSSIEDELLALTALMNVIRNPNLAEGNPDERRIISTAAGVYDLAAKVLAIRHEPEFPQLVPHLRLIAKNKLPKDHAEPSVTQNQFSEHDTARKMAELYLATLAIHVGSDVIVDDPEYSSDGKNPDVIFTLHPDPGHARRWAFAVKTIGRGTNPQSVFDRIKHGAQQIDDSAADLGIVIINTKNALPHVHFWNTAYPDEAAATNDLRSHINEIRDRADLNRPQTEWDVLFGGKCVRPVVFMGQTVVRLNTAAGGPVTPTLLRSFVVDYAKGAEEPEATALLEMMNFFMWSVSEGVPGSKGVFPK